MTRDGDKLAIDTADFALATHKRVEDEARRMDRLADAAGERHRAAELAARLGSWAAARTSPRHRRNARLAGFDERVAELDARRGALASEMAEIHERKPHAEAEHRVTLARWHADGGKGTRPVSPVVELEERLRQLTDDYDALEILIGETLAEKTAWVEKHRGGLETDARAAVEEAATEYAAAAETLFQARENLIAARRDEVYYRLFPEDAARSEAPATALVGGIVNRIRALVPGLQITLTSADLRRLLDADREFVTQMLTPQQREALRARDPEALRLERESIWVQTDEGQAALRRDRQEARERYRREWGMEPGW